jgi:hypothetical protein
VSGSVALCLSLPGVVVTWIVTGFTNPGKVDGSHPVLLKPALSGRTGLRWRTESVGIASVALDVLHAL